NERFSCTKITTCSTSLRRPQLAGAASASCSARAGCSPYSATAPAAPAPSISRRVSSTDSADPSRRAYCPGARAVELTPRVIGLAGFDTRRRARPAQAEALQLLGDLDAAVGLTHRPLEGQLDTGRRSEPDDLGAAPPLPS